MLVIKCLLRQTVEKQQEQKLTFCQKQITGIYFPVDFIHFYIILFVSVVFN